MYDFHNSAKNFRLVEPAKAWNEFKVKIENNFPVEQTESNKNNVEIVLPTKTFTVQKVKFTVEKEKFFTEIVEKIELYWDKLNRKNKETNAGQTLHAFPEILDWLKQKTSNWEGQTSASDALKNIKEKITEIYKLTEDTKKHESQKFLGEWEDYSKNIKGKFEVELDAPAPLPEAPKVRKVLKRKVRGHGRFEYLEPEDYEFNEDLRFGPGYHYSPRHMYHRGPHKVKGK
uniref:Uncharacterized protein n=1 Tax=Meloidogyne javanica TaxID=6303 RepID=A0A915M3Q6_MELJA